MSQPKSGYTLPVFACAGAIAALQHLQNHRQNHGQNSSKLTPPTTITLDLINPAEAAEVAIAQVALLSPTSALAITYSDPGDNLDLTRDTPIWSIVSWATADQVEPIQLAGGEGIGHHAGGDAIYTYARQLLQTNLANALAAEQKIHISIVLPEGKRLALRTSNSAFGVVEGLSLLGTSGISQPLSAPGQLDAYRQTLREKAATYDDLVFCLGENGLDLALKLGIEPNRRLKTANWIGPLLVEAGLLGVQSILLFGYHGKLIKLAGGIFHTHHHIADGRQEIMTACGVEAGVEPHILRQILASETIEAALEILRKLDHLMESNWVEQVYKTVAERIDRRSHAYIQTHMPVPEAQLPQVGSILFDRQRKIIVKSKAGEILLP